MGQFFLFLEQIAPSPAAHGLTSRENFCWCRAGELASEIPEIIHAFGPQFNAFMSVGILLKYFRCKLLASYSLLSMWKITQLYNIHGRNHDICVDPSGKLRDRISSGWAICFQNSAIVPYHKCARISRLTVFFPDFGCFQGPRGPFLSGKAEKSGQFPWVALSQATEKIIRKPFL